MRLVSPIRFKIYTCILYLIKISEIVVQNRRKLVSLYGMTPRCHYVAHLLSFFVYTLQLFISRSVATVAFESEQRALSPDSS